MPVPGPQTTALQTEADILFYGGAAGGGKSDLLIGAALTQSTRSIIFRREGTQLQGIYQRLEEVVGNRDGFNSQDRIWRLPGRLIEFGSCPNLGDEVRYQGRPHDLVGFDEITHFLEPQFRFLLGWMRTTTSGQRVRCICTGNPPTGSDGEWVIDYWAPWLKPDYPRPALPGELRWFATLDGKDQEVESGEPFDHDGEHIRPLSRTFIPSRVEDNPFLTETGYRAMLQSLPEPLRSQMLAGDFTAGAADDVWQIIPTAWVEAAQVRWHETKSPGEMDNLGVDPARGGDDEFVLAPRYGQWFGELFTKPGREVPDGATGAGLCIAQQKNKAQITVDVIGIGSSVFDHLDGLNVLGVNWAQGTLAKDATGQLEFYNQRAFDWWRMREALDPSSGKDIALPPDSQLKRDLCAPRWTLSGKKIKVESKEQIIKRLGRSPDRGDAVVLANREGSKAGPEQWAPINYGDSKWIV